MSDFDLNDLVEDEHNTDEIQTDEETVFKLDESAFNLPLKIKNFTDEKDFIKFVKNVERLVRTSVEYKLWVKYITDSLGNDKCALTGERINECQLEIHHHPINLFTIVKSITNKYILEDKFFSTFDIATDVIELHFKNKVGYILLLSDLHKKYHSGFLELPIDMIRGEYKFIMDNYQIDDIEYDRICSLCNITSEDVQLNWSKNNYPGIREQQFENKTLETTKVREQLE